VPGLHLIAHLEGAGIEVEHVTWFTSGRAVEEPVLAGAELRGVDLARVELPLEPAAGGAPSLARLALRLLPTTLRARRELVRSRAELVLGLGGFTSAPAILAARSLGLPAYLLEINASPGRATRLLAPLCKRVFHAFEATVPDASARHEVTGPPVDPRFSLRDESPAAIAAARTRLASELGMEAGREAEAPLLVVLGGSQGARGLNEFVRDHDHLFAEADVQVVHQVGPGRLAEAAPARAGYHALEYATDIPLLLAAATLVLCRGGASTLVEIAATGVPTWVVPYPHHADLHQERNARAIGGFELVQEVELGEDQARELMRWLGPSGAEERAHVAASLAAGRLGDGAARILSELDGAGSKPERGADHSS